MKALPLSLALALAQRFPVVARLVGPDFFAAMAAPCVAAHPPACPDPAAYSPRGPPTAAPSSAAAAATTGHRAASATVTGVSKALAIMLAIVRM